MKADCWDKCFLCLTNVTSSSSCGGKRTRGRQKQLEINETPNLSVLIKYLLGIWDQNENNSLLQRIRQLQLQQSSSISSGDLIKFCDKCQHSATRISNLQMELEVIQMKIVDILCSVRKTVIGKSNGNDGTSGLNLEEFTEERQGILDTLYAFQAAVLEKSKESVHVPLIYIEKFTGCNLRTNWAAPTATAEDEKNVVKTEPEADHLDEILSNLGDDYDSFDYHHPPTPINQFNEEDDDVQEEAMDTNNDVNITTTTIIKIPGHGMSAVPLASPSRPRKLQKLRIEPKKTKTQTKRGKEKSPTKRGRPRKNLTKVESSDTIGGTCAVFPDDVQPPNIKEEQAELPSLSSEQDTNPIIKEETFSDGKRKSRSAAQAAAKRIADVKKLSRATFQYRQRKIGKSARKTKPVKAKKSSQVKSKRKSASSSRNPPNPNKILLNPVLKTGKFFKRPKNPGNLRKSKQEEAVRAPRIKKYFQCEICPYKTTINFQFEHHFSEHETPEVVNHTCPHCTHPVAEFSQKQTFDYHMNSHAGQNKMGCDICPKFVDPFAILEHLRGHPDVEKIFQCCCCSYYCGTREGYLRHVRYHATAALICDVCSKKFHSRKKMLRHMHVEHKLLEKIKCDVANCNKEFFEPLMLTAHKKLHTEAFVCLECNLQFRSSRGLLSHQIEKHSREKPIRCSECPEAFIDKQSLQRHLINAHGAAKFKCPYCPKEYSSQGILNSHINLHEGISFRCDKCHKAFKDRRTLERHQDVHSTTKDFICEECGKAFRCESLLRSHIQIHNGDKKHKCSYCPKAFVMRYNLVSHERIHTGERPFVCEACGKDFNQRSALNIHRRTQHKELVGNKNKNEVTSTGSTLSHDELNVG